jgi:hypothetical protein
MHIPWLRGNALRAGAGNLSRFQEFPGSFGISSHIIGEGGGIMNNWWFALVVLGFGFFLTILVDRLKNKPGPPLVSRERKKWLYYWFLGRYPTKEEMDEEDDKDKPK